MEVYFFDQIKYLRILTLLNLSVKLHAKHSQTKAGADLQSAPA
jgi:hypothetical protein